MSDILNESAEAVELSSGVHSLPDQEFARDVSRGLSGSPKYLFSKYFYDEKGDELFQQIMELEEYYLTRAEYSIFDNQKEEILKTFQGVGKSKFDLLEFGAGDGYKTKVLLRHFLDQKANFKYKPVDISSNVLETMSEELKKEMPELNTSGLRGDYFQVLEGLKKNSDKRRVVLFLGSNIGNFTKATATKFLHQLKNGLAPGDLVMIGFDLKKDPSKILLAYNDSKGITRDFNLNLLTRINNELGADFDINNFIHYPYYDPDIGECRSYLISKCQHTVRIRNLEQDVYFKAWEPIHMEISTKFGLDDVQLLADNAGFKIEANFFDENKWFVDSVWRVV